MRSLHVRLPAELVDKIDEISRVRLVSRALLFETAVRRFIEKLEDYE